MARADPGSYGGRAHTDAAGIKISWRSDAPAQAARIPEGLDSVLSQHQRGLVRRAKILMR
jgi:hypothetical protein